MRGLQFLTALFALVQLRVTGSDIQYKQIQQNTRLLRENNVPIDIVLDSNEGSKAIADLDSNIDSLEMVPSDFEADNSDISSTSQSSSGERMLGENTESESTSSSEENKEDFSIEPQPTSAQEYPNNLRVTNLTSESNSADTITSGESQRDVNEDTSGMSFITVLVIIFIITVVLGLVVTLYVLYLKIQDDNNYDMNYFSQPVLSPFNSRISMGDPNDPRLTGRSRFGSSIFSYNEDKTILKTGPPPREINDGSRDSLGNYIGTERPRYRPTVTANDDYILDELIESIKINPILMSKTISLAELEFDTKIGEGLFGEVWKCQYRGDTVATKRVLHSRMRDIEVLQAFVSEMALTATLHHPHIIQFRGIAWSNTENLIMVMEHMHHGDLEQYLRAEGPKLSWLREKLSIATGIAKALVYLHDRTVPVLHRNLNAKNIVVVDSMTAKLIDFGTVEEITPITAVTPSWIAPEVLISNEYTTKADIYSFGMLLLELDSTQEAAQYDESAEYNERLARVSTRIMSLAMDCIRRNPNDRPPIGLVLETLSRVTTRGDEEIATRGRFDRILVDRGYSSSSSDVVMMADSINSTASSNFAFYDDDSDFEV